MIFPISSLHISVRTAHVVHSADAVSMRLSWEPAEREATVARCDWAMRNPVIDGPA